ncbi:MAG: phosphoribosylanthranilate isomerase [Paracoccaceae bacterium]
MAMDIRVKLCGLKTKADIDVAVTAGATYVGFVFHPKSPRHLSTAQAAAMATAAPAGLCKVALIVNADDSLLDFLTTEVPLDMLQLHGSEAPERVRAIKDRYGLPVMKAVGVADSNDLADLDSYCRVADQVLVDAKPPRGAPLPGGNGLAFDWELIAGRRWPVPWMLAGGLTPDNVAEAVKMTGARQVDVSSGIESAPGQKDHDLMRAFVAAAQAA